MTTFTDSVVVPSLSISDSVSPGTGPSQENWRIINDPERDQGTLAFQQHNGLKFVTRFSISSTRSGDFPISGAMPQVIGQGGVPIYILPTGTVAANGAITLGTALLVTESGGLWGYLPAGAAFAGSAAGFYWIVMSSTTVGTIYNNTYTPGVDDGHVPATPVPIVAAGPGAYTGVTTEVTAVSATLPGGSMGPNGSVTHRIGTMNNSSAGAKSVLLKWGTTTVSGAGSVTTSTFKGIVSTVTNRGAANSQFSPAPGQNDTTASAGGGVANLMAIDTTANVIISITITLAVATDWMALGAWAFETRYQP